MLKKIKREELPTRMKIFDGNWNRGIMIGNIIIFTSKFRREVKKVHNVYRHNNDTHGFFVKFDKQKPVVNVIYVRE